MLNIFRIFISDFKRIKTNVVAVVMAYRFFLACMHGLIFYRTGARMDRMQRRILKLQLHRTTRGSRLTTPSLIWVKL